jgi:hypothetical protein
MTKCICKICLKEFYIKSSLFKKGRGKYCSLKCRNTGYKISFKGNNNPFFGKHHSEDSRKKISETGIGRPKPKDAYSFPKGHKINLGTKHSENHKKKISEALKGPNSPSWKGGIARSNGRIFIFQPTYPFCNSAGYVRRSRLVMEQMINRYLKPEEVVHHINGVKDDDRPENLKLFVNQREHLSLKITSL